MLSQIIFFTDTLFSYIIGPIFSISCLECEKRPPAHIYPDKHAIDNEILCGNMEDRSLSNMIPTAETPQHQIAACLFVRAWHLSLILEAWIDTNWHNPSVPTWVWFSLTVQVISGKKAINSMLCIKKKTHTGISWLWPRFSLDRDGNILLHLNCFSFGSFGCLKSNHAVLICISISSLNIPSCAQDGSSWYWAKAHQTRLQVGCSEVSSTTANSSRDPFSS